MLNCKEAYGPDVPNSPKGLEVAHVLDGDDLIEVCIFSRWWEGTRQLFNLVRFDHYRVWRGVPGELVVVS